MSKKVALTEGRIRSAMPEEGRELFLWDSDVAGFGVRCYTAGRKVYFIQYRVGHGRGARQRRMPIGLFGSISLADARKAAKIKLGEVAAGRDPQGERREAKRREEARLDRALDAYEQHMERRQVVNRATIMATLHRELLAPVGKVDLSGIDRQAIAKQVDRIERTGRAGAAQDLRAKATTFLNWAVTRGLVYANPAAGWRRERATRAQMSARRGKTLDDANLKAVWGACDAVPAPFGDFVRILLLLGQRRGETAAMRWQDFDPVAGVWVIPAETAKNGRRHTVPLPQLAIEIINRQARWLKCQLVFAGRDQKAMSGWTPRMRGLVKLSGVSFSLHDCRRTFRSGLSRLGIDSDLSEMMLNHARADLVERYDRESRDSDRAAAGKRWAEHLAAVVGAVTSGAEVVDLASRRA